MRGIVTVLNTPFTTTGDIDFNDLRRTVDDALEAGVAGFLVGGLASEVGMLSEDERIRVLETILELNDARTQVIGGGFGETQADRVAVARRLIDCGCEGIMASLPFTETASFESNIRELADLHPGFLMIQDWDPEGTGIPLPVIKHLFETIPEFKWLKMEVIPAGPKYTEVLNATKGQLKVAGGWAVMQMIEALDRGVHVFMPTAMYRIYCSIYSRYAEGDRESAQHLFNEILPVLAFSNQNLDISIQFFKRLLAAQGVFQTDSVRIECPPFDEAQRRIADELIARVIAIEAEL